MGSGGYAAISNKAALAAQQAAKKAVQRKAVEKAAFTPDYGFDASSLPDLQQQQAPAGACVDMPLGDLSFFAGAFDDAPLDDALWGTQDVPAFGTLSVDALFGMPNTFGMPGSLPGSPTKAGLSGGVPTFISPLSSPLRAPGSPAADVPTPTASEAAPAAASDGSPALPADAPAGIPVVTSVPVVDILTSYASTGERDVFVVVTPRAPKRAADKAGAGASPRAVRQRSQAFGDDSEDSDVTAAPLESEDIMPTLIAAPLTSQEQVEEALPSMPTSQQTACGEIVSLSPTLWRDARRDAHPPFRIHVNAGLRSIRAPGVEAPVTLFAAIHPRIITTGQPHRRLGRARPGREEAPPPPTTRATRAHGGAEWAASSGELSSALRREKGAERDACILQEVWLLKRSLRRGEGHVLLDAHRCSGPFEGTTLPEAPAWTGTFGVDIVARVADPSGGTFWVKACNRSVQDLST